MESYVYDRPPSIPTRDVTLLYSSKDQGWCDYVVKRFKSDKLNLRLETLALDDSDYENPPEIEMAVRASRVLVLFTTTNLLDYMELKKDWFSPMLRKSDPEISVIINLYLSVHPDELEQFYIENPYTFKECNKVELKENASNITEVISRIIDQVEIYTKKKAMRDTPPQKKSGEDSANSVQIIPESIQKVGEKMALLFTQEISGEVTVNFNLQKDNVSCELVNPYCAVFTVPEIFKNESRITMQIDINGLRHSRRKLKNAQVASQFSSIDLLCQTHGASSREELDRLLASQFSNSLCSDPLAMRIFDTSPYDNRDPSQRTTQQYPTVLHWAAAHGLKELTSTLLTAPGAISASQVNNVNNDDPIDLAKKNGYNELSKYIYEFLEAQELANTCDLYVQFVQEEGDGDGEYEKMLSPGVFSLSSPTGVTDTSANPSAKPIPPPLPPRNSKNNSATSIDGLPSPKDFFADPPNVRLPHGALGSRSQTELIEIQEEVKRGNFSIEEAQMLFRSWKHRYMTGNAVSFRERQQGLKAFQDEHMKAVQLHRKVQRGNKKKISESEESAQTAVDISDPILKRQNNLSAKRQVGAGRGDSTNSNVSCQSMDSGRDSTVSFASQASFSSDDCEYLNPEDELAQDDMQMRSPNQSGRRDSTKANRQSMKEVYLSLVEESEHEGAELPPPPIPPRPMPRAPPIPLGKTKPRSMSQSALPTSSTSKTQVFVRRSSSNSSPAPIVAPRSKKK